MTLFEGTGSSVPANGIDLILAKLDGVKRQRKGWIARCPAHDDHTPSLSVGESSNGSPLLYCFAGCDPADVLAAIGLSWRDVLPDRGDMSPAVRSIPPAPCTLMAYAQAKGLSVEFLEGLGLQDDSYNGKPAVRIPYFDRDGSDLPFKLRLTLGRGHGTPFHWPTRTVLVPYGLWRLDDAIRAGYVLVVEGESDCHTLWHAGLPALGIPGANTWNEDWAAHLDGIDRIYVLIEPDRGGEAVREWLSESRIRERAYTVTLGHLAGVPR